MHSVYTNTLPSSPWDACYIKRASVGDLQSWLPNDTGSANAISAETPRIFQVRDEHPAARTDSEIRNLILKQARDTLCGPLDAIKREMRRLNQFQQLRLDAITRELHRLNRKRSRLENILQYEVLNRLLKVVDQKMKAQRRQHLTSKDYNTLKSANFLWFGNFVDLNDRFLNISPHVRAIATKVLSNAGNLAITQFRLCRVLMSRAGEQGRHGQLHFKPSFESAKAVISKMALTNPDFDADWWHAIINGSRIFSTEQWGDLEDIDAELENLQIEKAELQEGLLTSTNY